MATKFQFAGRTIRLPGVYSQIVSGRNNPPLDLDYGRLLIIAEPNQIRGGAGVNGENSQGKDSIYELRSLQEAQEFFGSGVWWKASESLFRPNRFDPGVSRVFVIKPCTTTAATLTLGLETGANGGTLALKTLDEGTLSNGIETTIDGKDYLEAGYAFTIHPGERNPSKWLLKFWVSSYSGDAPDTYSYNESPVEKTKPILLAKSEEFDNMQDLIDWAEKDRALARFFTISTSEVKGTGEVDSTEINALTGFQLATGATETGDVTDFTAALNAVQDLQYNFVMYKSGENIHIDTQTIALVQHLETDAKFDKFLIVGGSDDDLAESITSAQGFNSDKVILVHSGIKKFSQVSPTGFRNWNSHIHASYITGRLAGLPPQVPVTFKAINIDGLISNLNERQREDALDAGVLVTNFDSDRGLFVVEQGVNTLQDNDFTLNADATSHVIQIKRIAAQLNYELVINAKRDLLSNPAGVNRNTLSEQDIIDWTKGYLQRKVATTDIDNLIISFEDVTVARQEDAYSVTYKFEPNSEIRIVFFTGFML